MGQAAEDLLDETDASPVPHPKPSTKNLRFAALQLFNQANRMQGRGAQAKLRNVAKWLEQQG